MKLMPIITLLKNANTSLTTIESASSLLSLPDDQVKPPHAFIHPINIKAEANQLLGSNVSQQENVQFAVVIAARNINVTTGVEELETVRDEIKAALLAQLPEAQYGPIEYVAGDIVDVTGQLIWWRDTFETRHLIRG